MTGPACVCEDGTGHLVALVGTLGQEVGHGLRCVGMCRTRARHMPCRPGHLVAMVGIPARTA